MSDASSTNSSFNIFKKAFWRFVLVFLILHIIPNNLEYGFGYNLTDSPFWDKPTIWLGELMTDWEFNKDRLRRGYDSKYQVFVSFLFFLLAIFSTIIWLIVDKIFKKNYDNILRTFIQTVLRYHLAIIMLSYGLSKVFMLQFGTMDIDSMESTFGNQWGMSMMWTFMSFSKTFVMFSGWAETIGAILLFFRKTTFLGALILFGTLLGVVVMDIGYDVTVTMYAIFLFLLVIVLLSSQLKNLFTFLLTNKKISAEPYNYLFKNTKFNKIAVALKILILLFITYKNIEEHKERIALQAPVKSSWFTAKHTVEEFVLNGDTIPVLNNDNPKLWTKVIFNGSPDYFGESYAITKGDETKERYNFDVDSITKIIRYKTYKSKYDDEGNAREETEEEKKEAWQTMSYKKIGDREYELEAIYKGDTIYAKTKAKLFSDYTLIKNKGRFIFDLK